MFRLRLGLGAASIGLLFALSGPPALAQAPAPGANAPKQSEGTPKRGGTLTYMIPADAPPSFDGHRETTYATVHPAAPFYSVLIRVNPDDPASTTDFVCDLCTEMPKPTDGGKTYTFKIRQGVKFHDGTPLTAADVAESWQMIVFPPKGVMSPRQEQFRAWSRRSRAPDPETVVFRLKFATTRSCRRWPIPFAWIYKKDILEKDPHWYEKNIIGSGPFKFVGIRDRPVDQGRAQPGLLSSGQALSRRLRRDLCAEAGDPRRCDPLRPRRDRVPRSAAGLARRTEETARRQDRGAGERLELRQRRHDQPREKAVRRRARAARADPGDRSLERRRSSVEDRQCPHRRRHHLPGPPLAPTKEQLHEVAGYWPDIEKSRAEARRLLKEAGAENLEFELLNRDVDQPYKYVGIWLVDEWRKIGVKVTQRVLPSGPWFAAERAGDFAVRIAGQLPERRQSARRRDTVSAGIDTRITAISRTRRPTRCTTRCCTRPTSRSRNS